ncbi:hypothetical protein HUT16_29835 [Kitasatospora sp. NA04385]|uniref:hypothetical protein n=1 Tax=Kitasatospora sp. NA04385 TaxID=2742135 RepID=UPI001591F81E|nr:hypothetical protein [Kitasatospora sp. NA04385]QKW22733.1 hypothetical protein HUT16_29835 [Kitasatospora sp. NA04385]
MGTYVTICGWVECGDDDQLPLIQEIAEAERIGERHYRGGWTFPAEQPMWSTVAFFATCGRAGYEESVRALLERVAALPAYSADERVCGLFRVCHEVEGVTEWRLHGGVLHCAPAVPEHAYLDE